MPKQISTVTSLGLHTTQVGEVRTIPCPRKSVGPLQRQLNAGRDMRFFLTWIGINRTEVKRIA